MSTNISKSMIIGRVMVATKRACVAHSNVLFPINAAVTAYAWVLSGLTRGYGEIAVRIPLGEARDASNFVRKDYVNRYPLPFEQT